MKKVYNESKIGNSYHNLTVIKLAYVRNYRKFFACICDCGNETIVSMSHLVTGHTKSCGCLNTHTGNTKHGKAGTALYKIYYAMLDRCHNPKSSGFSKYGAKGITVCEQWRNSFASFLAWSEKSKYQPELTIDRIDNTLGYSPENCRWTNYHIQAINKGKTKLNTSGIRGVSFNQTKKLWVGRITVKGIRIQTCADPSLERATELHIKYLTDNQHHEHLKAVMYGRTNPTQ